MSKLPLIDLYLKIMFNSFNLKQFYMPCSISLMEYFDPYFFSLLLLFDVICTKYVYVQSQPIIATNTLLIPYIFI
ncbi:unnamed protein product [Cryptosporidium hominis]|uniref:Uncharacterized protein n=1 Tax=Cryptosporidium hominis TaxID=237895 RepID=A0A0S4TH58_CRYHO|nr:Uncharacterized protein GY17_00001626 [Cryptosporidium hominis]CUV06415.1 unnamed protein product [Cryptosporidium hominis]|eukprot:PPS96831.1 Uncharacterized protein GY17_00001626 [Cryptosporidium hominis]